MTKTNVIFEQKLADNSYISIIIPTYKDWIRLQLCLDALSKQDYPVSLFEIIIVNNDPSSKIPINFTLPSNAKIIAEGKPGSYAARNAGLKISKGKIVGFTDSDCLPNSNWISSAVSIFQSNMNIGRVTGPVNIFRLPRSSWLAWKFESITAFNQKHNVKKGVSVTANLFVDKVVFSEIGVFDSNLLSGGDIEWNQRATKASVSLHISDDVVVMHPARVSMRSLFDKSRRVLGGGYIRAKQENKLFRYTLRHFIPPVRYIKVLKIDGKPLPDIILATLIFWCLKVLMVFEILRLCLGGKPVR